MPVRSTCTNWLYIEQIGMCSWVCARNSKVGSALSIRARYCIVGSEGNTHRNIKQGYNASALKLGLWQKQSMRICALPLKEMRTLSLCLCLSVSLFLSLSLSLSRDASKFRRTTAAARRGKGAHGDGAQRMRNPNVRWQARQHLGSLASLGAQQHRDKQLRSRRETERLVSYDTHTTYTHAYTYAYTHTHTHTHKHTHEHGRAHTRTHTHTHT